MKEDRVYLEYVLQCIELIETYCEGGREEFFNKSMVQDAVFRRLQTLTESTQRLSDDLKQNNLDIDWRSISGFRNILVHDYLGGIDLNIAWEVINIYLSDLKGKIERILRNIDI
jgi:uncharacterized protein with HEPN domain